VGPTTFADREARLVGVEAARRKSTGNRSYRGAPASAKRVDRLLTSRSLVVLQVVRAAGADHP